MGQPLVDHLQQTEGSPRGHAEGPGEGGRGRGQAWEEKEQEAALAGDAHSGSRIAVATPAVAAASPPAIAVATASGGSHPPSSSPALSPPLACLGLSGGRTAHRRGSCPGGPARLRAGWAGWAELGRLGPRCANKAQPCDAEDDGHVGWTAAGQHFDVHHAGRPSEAARRMGRAAQVLWGSVTQPRSVGHSGPGCSWQGRHKAAGVSQAGAQAQCVLATQTGTAGASTSPALTGTMHLPSHPTHLSTPLL